MFEEDTTAAASSERSVLVIDEHGYRKWGKHTAHVGSQWLANIDKTESGVVSVSSLLAVGAMDNAQEILAGVLQDAPPRELRTLLEQVFSDRGLYLYVR